MEVMMSHRIGIRGAWSLAAMALAVTLAVAGEHAKCMRAPEECAAQTRELYQTRGWMGVDLERNEDGSLRVTSVVPDGPAERAGIREGDILTSLNGVVLSRDTLDSAMSKGDDWKIGGVLAVGARRGAETATIKVTLRKIPESLLVQIIETHTREYHPIARD
jgi:C-terminal processing protease CtpA/Prc